jgi:hypothetical protein
MKRILFISIVAALGFAGGAYGAGKISGSQIKNGTITGKHIKDGSLGTTELSNTAKALLRGTTGPAGPAGPAGAAGAPGLAGVQAVESPHISLAPGANSPLGWLAQCPSGKVVIGTGFDSSIAHIAFVKAYGTFVGAFIYNDTGVIATDLHLQAICASAGGAVASSAQSRLSAYNADRERALTRTR